MKAKHLLVVIAAAAAAAGLSSCTGKAGIEGTWIQPVPGMEGQVQGIRLDEGGKASSVNMATLQYESWSREGNTLVLNGKSIGNALTIEFSDTLTVEKLTADSLVLSGPAMTLRYSRQ